MGKLQLDILRQPNKQPFAEQAAAALGPLGRWWLTAESLRLIDPQAKPARIDDLPARAGGCWISMVRREELASTDGQTGAPLWRRSFLLPLIWTCDRGHSEKLPSSLLAVADDVVRALQSESSVRGRTFGLQLAADPLCNQVDLRGIEADLDARSGWASLAAGLWSAATASSGHASEPLPDTKVWATGCWQLGSQGKPGIAEVADATLPNKVALAEEYGARVLFVPETQILKARGALRNAGMGLAIERLHIDRPEPLTALAGYLGELRLPPARDAPFESLRDYYLFLLPRNRARARSFYLDRLFAKIAERVTQRFQEDYSAIQLPRMNLVTIASDSPELAPLAVQVLQARRCLVFHTADKSREAGEAILQIGRVEPNGDHCSAEPQPFDVDCQMEQTFRNHISELRRDHPNEAIVFDLTPASKLMSLALAFGSAKPGDWFCYLRHKFLSHATQDPGSERMLLWRVGEQWDAKGDHKVEAEDVAGAV